MAERPLTNYRCVCRHEDCGRPFVTALTSPAATTACPSCGRQQAPEVVAELTPAPGTDELLATARVPRHAALAMVKSLVEMGLWFQCDYDEVAGVYRVTVRRALLDDLDGLLARARRLTRPPAPAEPR